MARTLDDTGKHLIRILRQGGQAANKLNDLLFDGRDDIIKKVVKAMNSKMTMPQLTALIHKEVSALGKNADKLLTQQSVLAGTFQAQSSASYLSILGVNDPKVYNVTKSFVRKSFKTPMPAQNISVDDLVKSTMGNLDTHIVNITRTARIQGQTIRTVSKFIEEASGVIDDPSLARKAQALARTAITQVANDVRFQSFDNEPEVRGVLYVATLDHRTSNVCKVLDGTFYKRGEAANVPPLHTNCRSTLVPVLNGESLNGVKEQLSRPAVEVKSVKQLEKKGLRTSGGKIRKPSRSDRSPLKGVSRNKYVTYEQWIKQQPVAYQKSILGNKAYQSFRESGNLRSALGVAE